MTDKGTTVNFIHQTSPFRKRTGRQLNMKNSDVRKKSTRENPGPTSICRRGSAWEAWAGLCLQLQTPRQEEFREHPAHYRPTIFQVRGPGTHRRGGEVEPVRSSWTTECGSSLQWSAIWPLKRRKHFYLQPMDKPGGHSVKRNKGAQGQKLGRLDMY